MTIKVFISYKHQDLRRNQWVDNLYQDLRAAGVDAKLDNYDVAPGKSFSDYMTHGIRECDYVLFIITPKSVKAVESGFGALAFEVQIANARRMSAEAGFTIIPLLREGYETSTYLSDHRYLDFRKDAEYDQNLLILIKWLYGQIKPPPLGQDKLAFDQANIMRLLANTGISFKSDKPFRESPIWDTGTWLSNAELLFGLGQSLLAKGETLIENHYILPLGVPAYAFLFSLLPNLEGLGTKILPFFRRQSWPSSEKSSVPRDKPILFFDMTIRRGFTAQLAIVTIKEFGIKNSDFIVLLENDLWPHIGRNWPTSGIKNYLPIYRASELKRFIDSVDMKVN